MQEENGNQNAIFPPKTRDVPVRPSAHFRKIRASVLNKVVGRDKIEPESKGLVIVNMEKFNLELDYYGALNLHKALLEAKFHIAPDNELVSGSPLIAELYEQIRDFLIKSDESGAWDAWFQLKNRPDYRERALIRMKACRRWNKASSGKQDELILLRRS